MRSVRTLGQSLIGIALLATPLLAQKKALTQADWDRWRSIQSATLSNDGKWVAYTLSPQVGDGEFVVRSTTGAAEYRVPVGYIGRPNNMPGGERARGGGPAAVAGGGGRGGAAAVAVARPGPFTADSRYAFVSVQPNKDEVERQERAAAARGGRAGRAGGGAGGGGAVRRTRTRIVMVSLSDGKITPMPAMRSYRLPLASGKWIVYCRRRRFGRRPTALRPRGWSRRGSRWSRRRYARSSATHVREPDHAAQPR